MDNNTDSQSSINRLQSYVNQIMGDETLSVGSPHINEMENFRKRSFYSKLSDQYNNQNPNNLMAPPPPPIINQSF